MPDLSKLKTLFGVLAAVWAIAAFIFTWVSSVNAYDARIKTVEFQTKSNTESISRYDRMLSRMDYNVQIIARKVGVVPLEPTKQ